MIKLSRTPKSIPEKSISPHHDSQQSECVVSLPGPVLYKQWDFFNMLYIQASGAIYQEI